MEKYRQSGVIPYRFSNGSKEILVVTSKKKKKWLVPKGIIEEDLSSIESAEKEALEEAGIIGNISKSVFGHYEVEKWGGLCKVEVFPMKVVEILKEWEEDFRKRCWIRKENLNEIKMNLTLKKLLLEFFDKY